MDLELNLDHTFEVKESPEDAVMAMRALQASGWLVFKETVPLSGQCGFRCIMQEERKGRVIRRSHSILWNMYEGELFPIIIDCNNEVEMFSFVMQHGHHETFGYFEYDDDDDVGFVCYCRAHLRRSLVLRISEEVQCDFSDNAVDFLYQYEESFNE
jgi:hypothetical protein